MVSIEESQSPPPPVDLPQLKSALENDPSQPQRWLAYLEGLMARGEGAAAWQVLELGRRSGLQGEALERMVLRLSESFPALADMETLALSFGEGRLDQAIRLGRALTLSFPGHGFAWKVLGAALPGQDSLGQALACARRGAMLLRGDAEAHGSLGNVCKLAGLWLEAAGAYRRALVIRPDDEQLLYNLGNALRELDRMEEAASGFQHALRLNPALAEGHNNLGNALQHLGRYAEAVLSYRCALVLSPAYLKAQNNQGNAWKNQQLLDLAEANYCRALTIDPQLAELHNNLGNVRQKLGNPGDAAVCYRRALALLPDHGEVYSNLGNILKDLEQYADAQGCCRRALQIRPDYTQAYVNLGVILELCDRLAEAERCLRQALQLEPGYDRALINLGNVLKNQGRLEAAAASYRLALAAEPGSAEAHWNVSLCQLLAGDLEQGWQEYEWRWQTEFGLKHDRGFAQPRWRGKEDLTGKTVLVHAEQGLGDTLQFCRYAGRLAALGARVLLEVQAPLRVLLQNLPGVAQVLARGVSLPHFDYHCPLLSLPGALGVKLKNLDGAAYLQADAQRLALWRARLPVTGKRRLGLVWCGNPKHNNDRSRSIALGQFELLAGNGADCYCLQRELRPGDLQILDRRRDIRFIGGALQDFGDTAAVVSLLDLVITVDTSVAHLAGAMGKPVWILLPFSPDWRWLRDRMDSPWYRSARLFRQTSPGDWSGVLRSVRLELDNLN